MRRTPIAVPPIETGIPLPLGLGRPGRGAIYPWAEMEVGQSFAVPVEKGLSLRSGVRLRNLAGEPKFVLRRVAGAGYRVWRIA